MAFSKENRKSFIHHPSSYLLLSIRPPNIQWLQTTIMSHGSPLSKAGVLTAYLSCGCGHMTARGEFSEGFFTSVYDTWARNSLGLVSYLLSACGLWLAALPQGMVISTWSHSPHDGWLTLQWGFHETKAKTPSFLEPCWSPTATLSSPSVSGRGHSRFLLGRVSQWVE